MAWPAVILVNVDLLYKASNFGSLVTFVAISGGIFTAHELAGKFPTLPFNSVTMISIQSATFFSLFGDVFRWLLHFKCWKSPLAEGERKNPEKESSWVNENGVQKSRMCGNETRYPIGTESLVMMVVVVVVVVVMMMSWLWSGRRGAAVSALVDNAVHWRDVCSSWPHRRPVDVVSVTVASSLPVSSHHSTSQQHSG